MGNQYRKYTAFYPLNPTRIEIGTDGNNVWEIKFYWRDGSVDILPYPDVIHLKWRSGKNTIVGGGNDYGNPDTKNLLDSIKVLDQVLQGLPKSIEASLKITGLYTAKTLIDSDKIKAARDKFEEHIFTSKMTFLALSHSMKGTDVYSRSTLLRLLSLIIIN